VLASLGWSVWEVDTSSPYRRPQSTKSQQKLFKSRYQPFCFFVTNRIELWYVKNQIAFYNDRYASGLDSFSRRTMTLMHLVTQQNLLLYPDKERKGREEETNQAICHLLELTSSPPALV
jgi:hypothetical protein